MTDADEQFYSNQCLIPQIGYCTSYADKKWTKSVKRKLQDENSLQTKRIQASKYDHNNHSVSTLESDDDIVPGKQKLYFIYK